ncbi:hypothetical protein [Saccharothrix variisporea]|uniref:Uncharacterized protein n=1 Tax=Saccharothrix variisporea TaxID=543527 RepID=A0A495X0I9_9PSEU|nr:hypothetical protein [Saccharothrix variisporea]RKT67472.1 hypothetical protein DFJ66_0647 [Saccharothrix variisporea]
MADEPDGWITRDGKRIPIFKKRGNAGAVVLAGVVALGAVSGGAGISTIGEVTGSTASGQSVSVRKSEGRRDAKRGDTDSAWRRFKMRERRRSPKQQAECVLSSFGEVREYFLQHRCTSMEKILLAVEDDSGNMAVISVVWTGFSRSRDAGSFKTLMDKHGTGDIAPLGGTVLDMADIHFEGHNYGSDRNGNIITTAEAETATGYLDPEVLDALAEVAAYLPKP